MWLTQIMQGKNTNCIYLVAYSISILQCTSWLNGVTFKTENAYECTQSGFVFLMYGNSGKIHSRRCGPFLVLFLSTTEKVRVFFYWDFLLSLWRFTPMVQQFPLHSLCWVFLWAFKCKKQAQVIPPSQRSLGMPLQNLGRARICIIFGESHPLDYHRMRTN